MKNQKGITLIALIITIIIMLILVGVSVSISLNGGLFNTAKEASKGTEEKRDEELALSDGKVNVNGKLYNSMDDYINGIEAIPEELKRYVLGADLTGRPISEIYSSNSFKDDEATDEDETQTIPIEYLYNAPNEDNTEKYVYGNYNNTVYRIAYNTNTKLTIPEKTKVIYTPTGREGQDLGTVTGDSKYNGWTILYDYGNKVEAVAPFTSDGTLTLGSSDIDEAIESYNKAIELINDYVKAETTTYNGKLITYYTQDETTKGVRSVGAATDPTGDKDVYTSSTLERLQNGAYNGVGKKGDTSYEQDVVRMAYHNCRHTAAHFWTASRFVYAYTGGVDVCIRYTPAAGAYDYLGLWGVYSDGLTASASPSNAVRPVVTLQIL